MAYRYIPFYGKLKAKDVKVPWVFNEKLFTTNDQSWQIEDRCVICGQYILKDQDYFICTVPEDIRVKDTKYQLNFIVHSDEWIEFTHGLTEEELVKKFLELKTPRKPSFTFEQMDKIQAFKEACKNLGFVRISKDSRGIRISHYRKKRVLVYNVYYDHIDLSMAGRLKILEMNPAYEVKELMKEILFKKENCIL